MNRTLAPRSAVVRARVVCRAQQQASGDMPASFFCPNTKKPWYVLGRQSPRFWTGGSASRRFRVSQSVGQSVSLPCSLALPARRSVPRHRAWIADFSPPITNDDSPKCPRGGCRPCARNGVAPTLHKNAVEKEASQASQKAASSSELKLQSAPAAGLMALSLGGVNPFLNFLQGQADYFSTLNLPAGLIKYGHPGNMAVVLLAMGGYGALYLGWQIRLADNVEMRRKAMDLHPKLAGGMAVFFLLGSMGGMMSLLMQNENPFHSGHFTSGVLGLLALSLQAMLPLFFEDDPNARNFHAYFGTGVMALFFIHAALGVQLALSI